jgi:ubiquinone/menaquinone biosynthesis C-methylase UbiE
MLVGILTYLRDARWVWDTWGPVYNRRIYAAIVELYEHIVREMTPAGPVRILDVGAGRGYVSLLLASRNPQASIVGVDFSPFQVRSAERLRKARRIENVCFHRGNAMSLSFDEGAFDAAVSVGSVKHWPDALQGLREIRRVLRPGGTVVMAETDREVSDEALRAFIRRFSIWFIPDALLFWGLRNVVFGGSFTQESLEFLVQTAGFESLSRHRIPTCPYVVVKARKPGRGDRT